MGDVVDLPVITKLPLDPQRLIQKAFDAGLTQVVIIGFAADGREYFASSEPDAGNVLYHMERARWRLMKLIDDATAGG